MHDPDSHLKYHLAWSDRQKHLREAYNLLLLKGVVGAHKEYLYGAYAARKYRALFDIPKNFLICLVLLFIICLGSLSWGFGLLLFAGSAVIVWGFAAVICTAVLCVMLLVDAMQLPRLVRDRNAGIQQELLRAIESGAQLDTLLGH